MRLCWLLALLALLTLPACTKKAGPPQATTHDRAWKLFADNRIALPKAHYDLPFPIEEKFWRYAIDIDFHDDTALAAELTTDLDKASPTEQLIRATYCLERKIPFTTPSVADLETPIHDFLAGQTSGETVPDIGPYSAFLEAAYADRPVADWEALLNDTAVLTTINPSLDFEASGVTFETLVTGQRDFGRLRLAGDLIAARQLTRVKPTLLAIAQNEANAVTFRLEALRVLYALGETGVRDAMLFLAFQPGIDPAHGWATYGFLAEHEDPVLYQNLHTTLAGLPLAQQPSYLVALAHYGKPDDLPRILEYVLADLPKLPEERMGPSGDEIRPHESGRSVEETGLTLVPAVWSPDAGRSFRQTQSHLEDSHATPPSADDTSAADPHAVSAADFAAAFGYEAVDIETARRLRLLKNFAPDATRKKIEEAMLKGGPATRIVAGELLSAMGDSDSQPMLAITWADEEDPVALAELAHAWLMIEQRHP
ncbi:MAG: hypothetical protein ABI743_11040 [bacterium]